jgi:putative nucleotidyltransferase with HDIG domain
VIVATGFSRQHHQHANEPVPLRPMNAETFVAQVEDLSAPAPSVVQLLGLLNRTDVDNAAIVEIVQRDAVLTAKLLALANSAFFAPPRPIESCDEALFYLGHDQVYRLALAIGLGGVMNRKAAGYAMDESEFWRHSLLTAKACELLTGAAPLADGAVAYTAGLLHDIGKLVLNQFLAPASQVAVARVIEERGEAGVVAEQTILNTNHAEVGALLLRKWSLPEHMIQAVQNHHAPQLAREVKLSAMVALADAVAHAAASGSSGLSPTSERAILAALHLSQSYYEELLGRTSEALAQIEAVTEATSS